MVNCSAIGCANRSNQTGDKEIVFHRLPNKTNNTHLRQQWLNNIRREGTLPKDISFYICSDHFEESCYERDLQVVNFIIFISFW